MTIRNEDPKEEMDNEEDGDCPEFPFEMCSCRVFVISGPERTVLPVTVVCTMYLYTSQRALARRQALKTPKSHCNDGVNS